MVVASLAKASRPVRRVRLVPLLLRLSRLVSVVTWAKVAQRVVVGVPKGITRPFVPGIGGVAGVVAKISSSVMAFTRVIVANTIERCQ